MAVNNDMLKLAQYFAVISKKCENGEKSLERLEKVRNKIFDTLEDVNYKLPVDIPLKNFSADPELSHFPTGSTILHLAGYCQRLDDVTNLIKDRNADFTIKNENGQTVLHEIVKSYSCSSLEVSDDPCAQVILSAHVERNILENPISDEEGLSHFHIACMTNHVEAVQAFLNSGIAVNEAIKVNSECMPGYSPLQIAAKYRALETVEVLVENNAEINHKDVKGLTVLDILLQSNVEMLKSLNTEEDWGMREQIKADIERNERMIKALFARNDIQDSTGLSPLQITCTFQDVSAAQQLLENADLHYSVSQDSVLWPGCNALHFAAHFNINTVKLLQQEGADILLKDANNVTPFDLCVKNYKIEDIHSLVTNQQNLFDITFSDGSTRLSSFIFAMRTNSQFKSFINDISDFSICIPLDSPLWPGYTLLHVAIVFLGKAETILQDVDDDNQSDEKKAGEDDEMEEANFEDVKNRLSLKDIKLLMKKDIDVTAQDANERTALHLAFLLQRKDLVDLLLKAHKNNANLIDENDLSYLHIAVAAGNKALTEKLLETHRSDVNKAVKSAFKIYVRNEFDEGKNNETEIKMNAGSTALHVAIATGDEALAKLLVHYGADVHARDDYGLTPVHLIICYSNLHEPRKLTDFFESIENLEDRIVESAGLSYLHVAVCLNDKNAADTLIDQRANIESAIIANDSMYFLKTYSKMRPFELAYEFSACNVLELLVNCGAEVYLAESRRLCRAGNLAMIVETFSENIAFQQILKSKTGITPLHFACAALNVKRAEEAVFAGADVNAMIHQDSPLWPGFTPLHVIMIVHFLLNLENFEVILKLLVSHGADMTLKNILQETPIDLVYTNETLEATGYSQIFKWLLEAHTDFSVNPADGVGFSYFHIACKEDHVEIVLQFLNHHVNLNAQIDYFDSEYGGCTPLHLAVRHSSEIALDLLLQHGADLGLADRLGNTPLHCAIKKYPTRFELFRKLINAGANVIAANVYGVTPFEQLLHLKEPPCEMIGAILNHGVRANSFNPVTEDGYLAIAFSTTFADGEQELQMNPAFEIMMARDDLATVDDMGRNAIHNLVSYSQYNSTDNYVPVIDRLTSIGCNIDHQDSQGRTALHIATQSRNREAIEALLDSGADVNIVDVSEKSPIAYLVDYTFVDQWLFWPYYKHLRLLFRARYSVSERNVELFRDTVNRFDIRAYDERFDNREINRLRQWIIATPSLSLCDFLSDRGVTAYTMLKQNARLVIDDIFERGDLRREFPKTYRFLILRYKEALVELNMRCDLVGPAETSLHHLTRQKLPLLCTEMIIGFLANSELRNVINADSV